MTTRRDADGRKIAVGRRKRTDPPPGPPPVAATAPVVSIPTTTVGSTSVLVNATTDQPAICSVEYGPSSDPTGGPYSFTSPAEPVAGVTHGILVNGLTASTGYRGRIKAVHGFGLIGYSPERTWTTSAVSAIQGCGSQVTGGSGFSVVTIPPTESALRSQLESSGNRIIRFNAAGTIVITGSGTTDDWGPVPSYICPSGNNVTLDGSTAPGSGVTIIGTLYFEQLSNWIITQLRIRDADTNGGGQDDCITAWSGCHGMVFDHLSLSGANDGSLDISGNPNLPGNYDISVQWCMLGPQIVGREGHVSLTAKNAHRVTYHHNLFYEGDVRHPQSGDLDYPDQLASNILSTDVRCNLVWAPQQGLYGVEACANTRINAVKNYIRLLPGGRTNVNRHVRTETGGRMYASGNYSADATSDTSPETTMSEIDPGPGYRVTEEATALLAAQAVLAGAGCLVGGRDGTDQTKINAITAVGL
jgi:pectate lyase